MERLFSSYPHLEDDLIVLRKMSLDDGPALHDLAIDKEIYRYLPTFLFEQRYPDAEEVLRRMDAECFEAKDTILLGVYLKESPKNLIGIAEIYNYEEDKQKASIGYRLSKRYWGHGIGSCIASLLKSYLIDDVGLRMITAHVMKSNKALAKVLMNNGFVPRYPNLMEDWGFDKPVLTDKYAFKRSWLTDKVELVRKEFEIGGRRCTSFSIDGAECLLLQLGDGNDRNELDAEVRGIWDSSRIPFAMVFIPVNDWNSELSPWEAPAVFGKEGFGSGAEDTLSFVERHVIPSCISKLGLDAKIPVILGGYSLSAFFSLWSAYRTDLFSAVACASPSVWFPGWMDLARKQRPKASHIYLSLGDREEKTKNQTMSKVGSCIREMESLLREQGFDVYLEWNQGNHFTDTGARCANAFSWCLRRLHSLMQR